MGKGVWAQALAEMLFNLQPWKGTQTLKLAQTLLGKGFVPPQQTGNDKSHLPQSPGLHRSPKSIRAHSARRDPCATNNSSLCSCF